MNYLNRLGLV
nr:unnamed protein product [Callosobruchus analis]